MSDNRTWQQVLGGGVEPMTASKQAKEAGLRSLAQVSEITGVDVRTLSNWFHHKPQLFAVVLRGCKNEVR